MTAALSPADVFWLSTFWVVVSVLLVLVLALLLTEKRQTLPQSRQTILSERDRKDLLIFHAVKHTPQGQVYHSTHIRPIKASQMKHGDGR